MTQQQNYTLWFSLCLAVKAKKKNINPSYKCWGKMLHLAHWHSGCIIIYILLLQIDQTQPGNEMSSY